MLGAIKLQGQADHVESEKLNEVPIFKPREQVSEDGEAAATAEEIMTEDESTASRDAKQNLDRDPSKEKDMLLFKEEKVGADDTPKSTQAPNDTLVGDVGLVRRDFHTGYYHDLRH
ncbi:hypothetical protein SAY87_005238 [Trapa incisa]|uniref:Uncharacterized protein n=1 Tax=Trapa incisa TaxID=236973 RepID=A0AAN7KC24_9MYRT|nr:hypothetical protein SAY87_005238 [Trapa incisa]